MKSAAPLGITVVLFVAACTGVIAGWGPGHALAAYLQYWLVFELLGGAFGAGVYVACYERIAEARAAGRPGTPFAFRSGLVVFLCACGLAFKFLADVPLPQAAVALAMILPAQLRLLGDALDATREEALLRAGTTLSALIIGFFVAWIVAGAVEKSIIARKGIESVWTAFSMTLGACYYAQRIAWDAVLARRRPPTSA